MLETRILQPESEPSRTTGRVKIGTTNPTVIPGTTCSPFGCRCVAAVASTAWPRARCLGCRAAGIGST